MCAMFAMCAMCSHAVDGRELTVDPRQTKRPKTGLVGKPARASQPLLLRAITNFQRGVHTAQATQSANDAATQQQGLISSTPIHRGVHAAQATQAPYVPHKHAKVGLRSLGPMHAQAPPFARTAGQLDKPSRFCLRELSPDHGPGIPATAAAPPMAQLAAQVPPTSHYNRATATPQQALPVEPPQPPLSHTNTTAHGQPLGQLPGMCGPTQHVPCTEELEGQSCDDARQGPLEGQEHGEGGGQREADHVHGIGVSTSSNDDSKRTFKGQAHGEGAGPMAVANHAQGIGNSTSSNDDSERPPEGFSQGQASTGTPSSTGDSERGRDEWGGR